MTRRNFGLRPKTPAQHLVERNADLLMPTWPAWVAFVAAVLLAVLFGVLSYLFA